ncbi:hypothetical protein GCM10010967_11730 [Dyadobacter beijingensis]|uniref:Peptidase C14 caspase domain-containing protein n=1 Tax=Dyadobacter beijingensis TaxID=365489 RepID=A0ABQ2HIU0_9BACT|nr:caspase family protein [Dyadobacter beijingensis]GGM81579.1 hypothetical protein GCM10010967_11730 [Dyadobacter beijingensis]
MSFSKILISLCLVWIAGAHTLYAQGDSTRTYAVVIGISHYQQASLPQLQFADKDATLFAAHLRSSAGGNVPKENIKLLLNEDATIAAIYDALNWLQERCRKNDKAYFYFSGHGDVETQNSFSLGYLLAHNSPATNYRNNAIRIEDINKVANHLSTAANATVVLVTDACHTGKLAGDYYKGKQLVASQLKLILNNEVRLAACGVDEKAAEGLDWGGGRGAFSYYLLKGLNGPADRNRNDTIQLRELQTYLDSVFATDRALIRNAHRQHPSLDGNPYQTLAFVKATSSEMAQSPDSGSDASSHFRKVLDAFKPVGIQPVDYFFRLIKTKAIESRLRFSRYASVRKEAFPLKLVDDCLSYQAKMDSLANADPENRENHVFANSDTLILLKNQLAQSNASVNNFNERFVQMVHGQAQDMVNAYLEGDEAELERRQYYYAGNRQYGAFVQMLQIAIGLTPPEHYLLPLLHVQEAYLTGLTARLEMATSANGLKLLARAFRYQRQALKLEPYAAFIYNEMGNLYLRSRQYAQADRQFEIAKELSPAWAIPWSNQIRLNLAAGNLKKAKTAIAKADSLQNDLAYTYTNAGMVMLKQGDLLAAEGYFRKAIARNNVHFLPFQKLGELYTRTGKYRDADWFLAAAQMRRKDFAVNDQSFEYGIELGGLPSFLAQNNLAPASPDDSISPAQPPFVRLIHTLGLMRAKPELALSRLKSLLNELSAGKYLAYHYIGKIFYENRQWQEAEPFFAHAAHDYQSDSALIASLRNGPNSGIRIDSSATVVQIAYQYDALEDHYYLGSIYENLGKSTEAITQYTLITRIENQRQRDQAIFKGFDVSPDIPADQFRQMLAEGKYGDPETLLGHYENPVVMGGYIKLGSLYEKAGNYEIAEKVYLEQVKQDREAGNARSAATVSGPFQRMSGNSINYYRVAINRLAEAQTRAFYQQMLRRFARDTDWHRKAGLFLYDRLRLAFQQIPVSQFKPVYESINQFAYPFMTADETETGLAASVTLPGTQEQLHIPTPKYDPLKEALESLEMSVKLSGDLLPDPLTLEAIADLNSWMGNAPVALKSFRALSALRAPNPALRNKIVAYALAVHEYPLAVAQLSILYQQKLTTPAQNMVLAECNLLSGSPAASAKITSAPDRIAGIPKPDIALLNAKTHSLAGRYAQALSYLRTIPAPGSEDMLNDSTREATVCRYYTIARLNALLKQNTQAFNALTKALQTGFNFGFLLAADPAWNALRTLPQWERLQKDYAEQLQSRDYVSPQGYYNALDYRIPDSRH